VNRTTVSTSSHPAARGRVSAFRTGPDAPTIGLLLCESHRNPIAEYVRQKGARLGNWLTREQAKELLAVPGRSKLKGKRDYVIIALLVGCALRRQGLATLNIEDIQLREGRWVVIDLRGKGGRIRTVAVPQFGIMKWPARRRQAGSERMLQNTNERENSQRIGGYLEW
jgi:integrase